MEKLIIKTTDVYEIVWYFIASKTIVIESIEVLPRGKQSICQFALSGENLNQLQNEYLQDKAIVSIKEFRKVLCHVNGIIEKARKEVKQGGNSMKTITISNTKGGTGKTTTTLNLINRVIKSWVFSITL